MTQVGSIRCIELDALESALSAGSLSDEMKEHLDSCLYCREQEAMIRENLEFMGGVVQKLGSDVLALPPRGLTDPLLLPGYELVREIARGGQGVVFEAVQIETKRRVAIKLIETGDADGRTRRRVEREAELAASLRHPNIVSLYQRTVLGDGRQALAMEYVEGVAIDEWARAVDAATPPSREALRTAVRVKLKAVATVCDALQHAHVNGVIHRDLKPANVLVTSNGVPRIVDFGIARRVASETRITRTGAFAGTLAYASPEQVSGQPGSIDIRSDVYSLGLMVYEVLTGRRPYDTAGSLSGAIANITRAAPAPLRVIQPGNQPAGEELESIIERALAKDRSERYQSAAALKNDIDNWLAGKPVEARHHSTVYLLKKLALRHRVAFLATACVIVLLATFAGVMAWSSGRLARQRSLLQASLASSTIERGRLMGLNGENGRAEALIWPELIRSGVHPNEPAGCFEGKPEVVQAMWALFELYSRHPVLNQVPVTSGMEVLRWSDDGKSIHLITENGSREVRSAGDGSVEWSAPALVEDPTGNIMMDSTRRRALIERADGAMVVDTASQQTYEIRSPTLRDRVYDLNTDGSRMVTLSADGRMALWKTNPIEQVAVLEPTLAAQSRPRFSPDGSVVLAGVGDNVNLWRSSDGVLERSLKIPPALWTSAIRAVVRTVRMRPGGEQLGVGFHNSLLLFPMDSERPVQEFEAHRGFVGWIEYSQDGSVLLTSGSERNFKTWNPTTGELLCAFEQIVPPRGAAAVSPDGAHVACCDTRDTLSVVESRPRQWFKQLPGAQNTVHCVRFSPDGSLVASVSSDGYLRIWKRSGGTHVSERLAGPDNLPLEALCFDPAGERVYVAGQGGVISVGPSTSDQPLSPLFKSAERVTWLGCSPNGRVMAVLAGATTIDLFDLATGQATHQLTGHSQRVIEAVFSDDGDTLYSVGGDGVCIAWDVKAGTERFRTEAAPAASRAICLSPDGRTIVTGCDDWNIRMWDARTGAPKGKFSGAKQHVFGLAFHPKGNILFSCNRDSLVQVWDVRTGRELAVLDGHAGLVLSLAVSPDGMMLATASSDRTVGLWDLGYYRRHLAGGYRIWQSGVNEGNR